MDDTQAKYKGFNLLELMVSIAIISILVSVAIPSFNEIINRSQTVAISTDFSAALQRAKSESVTKQTAVIVCILGSGSQCADSGSDWAEGWLIYQDNDGDGSLDTSAGDTIIDVYQPSFNKVTLTDSNTSDELIFLASGNTNLTGGISFNACDPYGSGSQVLLTVLGYSSVIKGGGSC